MRSFLQDRLPALRRLLDRRALQGRLNEVEERLNVLPFDLELLEERAELESRLGDVERAMAAHRELAVTYVRNGLYGQAIATYHHILELDPRQPEVHRELARLIAEESTADAADEPMTGGAVDPVAAVPEPAPAPPPTPTATPSASPSASPMPAGLLQTEGDGTPAPPPSPSGKSLEDTQARIREQRTSDLFRRLPEPALEELLASTALRSFSAGQVVFSEGEPGNSLFLLVQGLVEVVTLDRDGDPVRIAALGAGELFGGVSIVYDRPRAATVRAVRMTYTVEVARERIDDLGRRHPELLGVLRRLVEERAQQTIDVLVHGRPPAD